MGKFSSKKALLLRLLSMVICVSMLIGSTFAWFTDSATANVNEIKSGNLDIVLEKQNADGTWSEVSENTALDFLRKGTDGKLAEDANIFWEPGCTFELPMLRIRNNGNLALKYQVVISGATGDTKLLDVIKFTAYVGDDTQGTTVNVKDGSAVANGMLVPAEKADETNKSEQTIKISAHMDETANNNYKNLTLKDIKISVVATHATYEYDSNSNQYDAGLEFSETIAAGKTFTGKATVDTGIIATNPDAIAVKAIGADADVTINGGFFDGGKGGDNIGVCATSGAKVTINGGTFTVGGDANGYGNSVVYSQGGTVVINGGFFYTNYSYGGRYYVLNQSNGNPGTITVYGGTFVNYDPSTGDDNLGGNFVADGYSVISETKANGDVWYTVVEGTGVSNSEDLKTAIASAEAGDTIVLASGKYTVTTTEPMSISGVTFKAAPGATVDGVYLISNSSETRLTMDNITFDGISFTDKVVLGQDRSSWGRSQCSNIKFVNCNFDLSGSTENYPDAITLKGASVSGTISEKEDVAYVKGVTIEDCSFTNIRYALFCGKGRDVSIKNCKVENASSYAFRIDDVAGSLAVEGNTVTNAEGVLKINTVGNNYSTTDITTNVVVKGNNAYNMTCGNGNVFVTTFDNAKSSGKSTYTITGNSCTYTESFETPLCGFRIKSNYGPSRAEFIENN